MPGQLAGGRRLWPVWAAALALGGGLWWQTARQEQARAQLAQAEQLARRTESLRQVQAAAVMNSDPVRFQVYVRQVGIAADIMGQGEQDISGPCSAVSGFENGVGDPPPETQRCTISDPGSGTVQVELVLKDGRHFTWPPPATAP